MESDGQRYRVRQVRHRGGQISYWIFSSDGELHHDSMRVLASYGTASQQTYAFSLVDHLNWLHINGIQPRSVTFDDLRRYMNALTNEGAEIFVPWRRADQRPLGASSACNVATVVKAFYMSLLKSGKVREDLVCRLDAPASRTQRGTFVQRNPLAPKRTSRRPRVVTDATVQALFEPGILRSARDVMIVTWLHDTGIRVGGLCGLRFTDLHLVADHPCGQHRYPHIHVVGRNDNPNGARAKIPGALSRVQRSPEGHVIDGVIRAVSDDMISTFHAYLLDEYRPVQHFIGHQQALVHTGGRTPGAALTTAGVRGMLRRAGERAALSTRVTPHAFRHKAASDFYAATDFNAEEVAEEFGWSRPEMVTELYGKSASSSVLVHLGRHWAATARPSTERDLVPDRK
ncbi:tyrosine-type recombinase/integrase [Rhodococcus opacus]|nr:tyrosine-type recombinase/integrase [Rhodococcus opacus]